MRIRFQIFFVLFLLPIITIAQQMKSDQLIVQFRVDANAHLISEQIQSDMPHVSFGLLKRITPSMNIWVVDFNENQWSVEKGIAYLKKLESVEIVQPNHTNISTRATTPNDQDYPAQWSLNGTGGGRIDAPEAWDITTGGTTKLGDEVVIAVIDEGFDLGHYDLTFFENTNEIFGNGIDDDQNGYVDDFKGWNAYNSSGIHPTDDHGTHVAGIAGANGNNGSGIAGISWDAKILAISGSSTIESVVLESYGYALEMRKLYEATNGQKGAYVVATNSSFGVDFGNPVDYPIWCAFYDTLGQHGIVNAAATTNGGIDVDIAGDVPTTCPSKYVVAVANCTQNALVNGGYGENSIDMAAPGTDIYSTIPGNNLGYKTGTSMATPHVAGTIALMYSAMCSNMLEDLSNDPQLMADTILNALLNGTDSLSSLNNKIIGSKRLNLRKALENILDYNCIKADLELIEDSCGLCQAAINFNNPEGAVPYTYQWETTTSNGSSLTQLCEEEYKITITDTNGYQVFDTIQLAGEDSLVINFSVTEVSASGSTDGSIDLSVFGGAGNITYLWNDGSTQEDRTNLPVGNYTVTVTASNGCQKTVSIPIYITSIDEVSEHSISVYPNPFHSQIQINGLEQNTIVELFDIRGKRVYSGQFSPRKSTCSINLSNLPKGLYLLSLSEEKGSNFTHKIMKY